MSMLAQGLALLPAIAAIVLIVIALADHRDAAMLDGLRGAEAGGGAEDDDLERTAA